jgi:ABC-2 type transport system ATP-binding protein/lipopolysaccharide transport system ATP-binding protein
MAEPSITASGVSVVYRLPHYRGRNVTSFKELVIRAVTRQVTHTALWAARDLSFTVQPGDTLGVIGSNGAGKTTLLKVLAGVLPPSHGRVVVRGQVAPMIELGGGFQIDLSAQENIVLLGALLGREPRQMRERVPAIAAWAELEGFLDVPLRAFSSGMLARLAFAVVTDTKPDVLVIDEVLAVGDASFYTRSVERMDELTNGGTTLVLASHDMTLVRERTARTLWLEHGVAKRLGPSDEVVDEYLDLVDETLLDTA